MKKKKLGLTISVELSREFLHPMMAYMGLFNLKTLDEINKNEIKHFYKYHLKEVLLYETTKSILAECY